MYVDRILGFTFYLEHFIDAFDHQISHQVACQSLMINAHTRLFPLKVLEEFLHVLKLFRNIYILLLWSLAPGVTSSRTKTNSALLIWEVFYFLFSSSPWIQTGSIPPLPDFISSWEVHFPSSAWHGLRSFLVLCCHPNPFMFHDNVSWNIPM